jgi:microcystin-dependent protein
LSQPYIAEVRLFSFGFAPKGYAMCNGQTLAINQNTALFSLLGTTYGGNGVSTFMLPDLRSRTPVHVGTGGGSTFVLGATGGVENVTLIQSNFPQHNHPMQAQNTPGLSAKPAPSPKNIGQSATGNGQVYSKTLTNLTTLISATLGMNGSNVPHTNIQPYLTINFCIALSGVFPSRN